MSERASILEFMWREQDRSGKRVRRTSVIGTIEEYPTKELARAAVNSLRMQINEQLHRQVNHTITVGDLIEHYIETELSPAEPIHSHATRLIYREFLIRWIKPRLGTFKIIEVRTIAVETWLRELKRRDGEDLANSTKAKIRSVTSVLFNHAIRYEWPAKNPNYTRPTECPTKINSTGPDGVLSKIIRHAAVRAGRKKRIDWHTFRHTYFSTLIANGENVKVVQELMRNASSRFTLEVYTQAKARAKR